jgi:hypothetical protein
MLKLAYASGNLGADFALTFLRQHPLMLQNYSQSVSKRLEAAVSKSRYKTALAAIASSDFWPPLLLNQSLLVFEDPK